MRLTPARASTRTRASDEDVLMSAAEVQRMAVEAFCRRRPWDGQASDRPVSDVDEGELRSFVERGNACGRIGFPFAGVERRSRGSASCAEAGS